MIEDDNESLNSDEELQEAFAAGLLKPGLNIPTEEKIYTNNVNGLKLKLKELKYDINWVERMDINTKPAPMAPEIFHEISEKEKKSVVQLRNHIRNTGSTPGSIALDDFKREMLFHRQAQAALIEGVARLTTLKIPTQRPEDYFAEMAKSDEHMHKVRKSLAAKQTGVQRAERIGQLRKQKKLSKQMQIENKLKQANEKKKMLTEVQKFRKGVRKDLDFLDGSDKKKEMRSQKSAIRRKQKDEKYGFGGKKRGMKRNTKDSAADIAPRKSGHSGKPGGKGFKGGKAGGKGFKGGNQRPGKSKRMKAKGRK